MSEPDNTVTKPDVAEKAEEESAEELAVSTPNAAGAMVTEPEPDNDE